LDTHEEVPLIRAGGGREKNLVKEGEELRREAAWGPPGGIGYRK